MDKYVVCVNCFGDIYRHLNGGFHCEDGPAIEESDGTKEWWINDELHREDGPAIKYGNGGRNYWYLNGKELLTGEEKYIELCKEMGDG